MGGLGSKSVIGWGGIFNLGGMTFEGNQGIAHLCITLCPPFWFGRNSSVCCIRVGEEETICLSHHANDDWGEDVVRGIHLHL